MMAIYQPRRKCERAGGGGGVEKLRREGEKRRRGTGYCNRCYFPLSSLLRLSLLIFLSPFRQKLVSFAAAFISLSRKAQRSFE